MADYEFIVSSGVIVPDTADILSEVQAEYQGVFGPDLSTDPETPQGLLISADALSRARLVENNAAVGNQINPNLAGGIFLQAICALTGLDIPAATPSTTLCDLGCLASAPVSIPAGARARTDAGDVFELVSAIVVTGGSATGVLFQSVEEGPIPANIGTLTHIVTDVLGWETINNPGAVTLGVAAPSDAELRTLRNETLALQGSSLAEAVRSAIAAVSGFKSHAFRENVANTTQTIDGISLVTKSVWACVLGGTDLDIATALLDAKSGGCAWNGATTVNVVDPASGQTYAVKFDRPTAVPMLARITARVPNNAVAPVEAIKQAVVDYANGLISSQPGFVVGGGVSPFETAGAVMAEVPGVYVQKSEVATVASGVFQTTEIALALNQVASITTASITVVIVT